VLFIKSEADSTPPERGEPLDIILYMNVNSGFHVEHDGHYVKSEQTPNPNEKCRVKNCRFHLMRQINHQRMLNERLHIAHRVVDWKACIAAI
jgi:hypothetical protein